MLPVKALGTEADWLCVDCSAGARPVYVFYDNWASGGPYWPDMFEPVSASFEDFLYGLTQNAEFPPGRPGPENPYGRP